MRLVYTDGLAGGRLQSQFQLARVHDANRGGAGEQREGFAAGMRASYQWQASPSSAGWHSVDLSLSQRHLEDRTAYAPALFPGLKRSNRMSQAHLHWHYQVPQSPWSWRIEWQYLKSEDRLALFDYQAHSVLVQSQFGW